MALLATACCLGAADARAAEAERPPPARYEAGDFARFQPATALDMVERIPGFGLSEGAKARGLSESLGNVLIDGRPHTSKTEGLRTALAAIPATEVARIEVFAATDSDLPQAVAGQIANVVLKASARPSGAMTVAITAADAAGGVSVTLAARRPGPRWAADASAKAYEESTRLDGGTLSRRGPSGAVEAELLERSSSTGAKLVGGLALPRFGDGRLHLTANAYADRGRSIAETRPSPGATEAYLSRYATETYEASADYERTISGRQALKLTLLQGYVVSEYEDLAVLPGYEAQSRSRSQKSESVVRAALDGLDLGGNAVSLGIEGAGNRLEGRSEYRERDQPVGFPSQDVTVAELRAEAFARLGGALSSRWRFEAAMSVEAARLRLGGDTRFATTYTDLRPSLSTTYAPDSRRRLTLALSRRIGQLDFSDFITSVGLRDLAIDVGNPQLQPVRRTRLEVAFHQTFGLQGALTLSAAGERIDNPQELIPIGGRDAPGNLGRAWRGFAEVTLESPLDRIGAPGGMLTLAARFTQSGVDDPVTGAWRRLSGEVGMSGELAFRQDLPRRSLSWGFDMQAGSPSRSYRLREVKRYSYRPLYGLEVEYRPATAWSVRLRGQFGGASTTGRDIYAVSRAQQAPSTREVRRLPSAAAAYLTIRRELR